MAVVKKESETEYNVISFMLKLDTVIAWENIK